MKEQTFTLGVGELTTRSLIANYIRIVEAAAPLKIRARMSDMKEGRRADSVDMTLTRGRGITLDSLYDTWEIENKGAGSQTVTIALGRGKVEDTEISGNVTATISKSLTVQSLLDVGIPAVSTVLVAAADLDRRELHITNQGPSNMRWGDSGIGVVRGGIIYPGQTAVIESSAAIYVYNSDAALQYVALVTVKD